VSVPAGYAAWLQSDARYLTATIAGAALWGDKAKSSSGISPYAYQADARAEVIRQSQFLAGPFAIDTMLVKGRLAYLVGYAVALQGDRFDYEVGSIVFVLEADETAVAGSTQLTVLKRL
jgi:hypothetical protein